jgi:hypothetical protein
MLQFCVIGLSTSLMPTLVLGQGITPYTQVLATVMFNYGFVATMPSWLNEKHPSVSVETTTLGSVTFATALYLLLGFFGALSGAIPLPAVLVKRGELRTRWLCSQFRRRGLIIHD